ncbi:unnamed protein product [Linum trigynum]|uniref:Uncharacterized protein n=1 Tax=Linum trigynum TaxID=586398 RepID=A0AAV2CZY3_9ROSI
MNSIRNCCFCCFLMLLFSFGGTIISAAVMVGGSSSSSRVLNGIKLELAESSFAQINPADIREPDKIEQHVRELLPKMNFFFFLPVR